MEALSHAPMTILQPASVTPDLYQRAGNWRDAESAFRRAISTDPAYHVPHKNLTELMRQYRSVDERIAVWRQIVDAYPQAAPAYN